MRDLSTAQHTAQRVDSLASTIRPIPTYHFFSPSCWSARTWRVVLDTQESLFAIRTIWRAWVQTSTLHTPHGGMPVAVNRHVAEPYRRLLSDYCCCAPPTPVDCCCGRGHVCLTLGRRRVFVLSVPGAYFVIIGGRFSYMLLSCCCHCCTRGCSINSLIFFIIISRTACEATKQ